MLRYTHNKTLNNCPPFGSCISNRGFSSAAYRFGFNNQEKDGELGDSYAFEYRIHDARLGRFLSVDPVMAEYPWNSSYCFAENDIIRCVDLEGREKYVVVRCWDGDKFKGTICIYLPDEGTTRLYRGSNANANKTMIINLQATDSDMATLRGDIFKRVTTPNSKKESIVGLTDKANELLFSVNGPIRGKKDGAKLVDVPPNESELNGCEFSEKTVLAGNKMAARLIRAELREFHYNFDESVTVSLNAEEIKNYKDFLDKNPDYEITVVGYTDKKGDPDYNLDLGLKRANDVKKYLISQGIDASRIKTVSKGESEATVDENSADSEREADRKVTIQWTPPTP